MCVLVFISLVYLGLACILLFPLTNKVHFLSSLLDIGSLMIHKPSKSLLVQCMTSGNLQILFVFKGIELKHLFEKVSNVQKVKPVKTVKLKRLNLFILPTYQKFESFCSV